jgi:hypothetical protein
MYYYLEGPCQELQRLVAGEVLEVDPYPEVTVEGADHQCGRSMMQTSQAEAVVEVVVEVEVEVGARLQVAQISSLKLEAVEVDSMQLK